MIEPTELEDKLTNDPDVLCAEVYGSEFVCVLWNDPDHGIIANLRFGSGRHHTAVNPELDQLLGRDSIGGVNIIDVRSAKQPSPR